MAHFARVEGGIVQEVIVVANDAIDGGTFPDSEALGLALLAESGIQGEFHQCSFSGAFRGVYPGVGWLWDGENFINPYPAPIPEGPITKSV